ncbi:MAG: hypothetical protein K6F27_09735 [Ruminococcus sp.]|nr:hypothetical protein [Ruminococcus sp.]
MNLLNTLYVKHNPTYKEDEKKYIAKAYNVSETKEYSVQWNAEKGSIEWDKPTCILNSQGKDVLLQNGGIKAGVRYEVKFLFFKPKEFLKGLPQRKQLFFEQPEYDESSFYAHGADELGNKYTLWWKGHTNGPYKIKREDGTDCTNEDWELVFDEELYNYSKCGKINRFMVIKTKNENKEVLATEKFFTAAHKIMFEDFQSERKTTIEAQEKLSGYTILPTRISFNDSSNNTVYEWLIIDLLSYAEKNKEK